MELLPKEIATKIPKLYTNENNPDSELTAWIKLFTPDSNWTWYLCEFDGQDICFGLVIGHEKEMGYFSLSELKSVNGPLGLPIERDLYFTPKPLSQCKG